MGISHYLYNAPQGHSGMHADGDESLPIAKAEEVKNRISPLFPELGHWEKHEENVTHPSYNYPNFYSALGRNNCNPNNEYLDITLMEHGDGYIHIIDVDRASPKLIKKLIEAFNLSCVWQMQACTLVDPYQFVGNWEPITKTNK